LIPDLQILAKACCRTRVAMELLSGFGLGSGWCRSRSPLWAEVEALRMRAVFLQLVGEVGYVAWA
jgi:hypothetical protein